MLKSIADFNRNYKDQINEDLKYARIDNAGEICKYNVKKYYVFSL